MEENRHLMTAELFQ